MPDLAAARRFYVDGLGWSPAYEIEGEIVFLQVGHGRLLSLFGAQALAADAGAPSGDGPAAMSLAQVVATEDEVHAVAERAATAGGTVLKPPQRADWGGFHTYFADPAGFRWEVATNTGWSVAADGTVHIGPAEA